MSRLSPRHPTSWAAFGALCFFAAGAFAAEALTLPAAVNRALERSPALAAAQAGIAGAEARITQAQLKPQLEVGLELENFAGSGELDGTDTLETTLQLSRAVEFGGKRERRVDLARAGRESALVELDAARVDVAAEVTRRYIDLLSAQEQLRSAERFLTLAQAIRDQAGRRVKAGNALSAELHRAEAEVGREELFGLRSRSEIRVRWSALASTWGAPESAAEAVVGDLRAVPVLEPLESLLARLEQTPRFRQLATQQRLRGLQRRIAAAEARPDITVALGLRHLSESDDTGLVAGFSVPLGSRARSRANVAESDAVTMLRALHLRAQERQAGLGLLRDRIVPATASALQQVERGYRLGRLSYGEYAVAAREALDAELQLLQIATEYHQLLAEIEGLTGIAVGASPADSAANQ
jgi:cobalt-zinc-cadmium efflux system outer membrane protein